MIVMSRMNEILQDSPGETLFLLGNEAVARGVIEAGVSVAATYPGTPSSEVGDTLFAVYREAGIDFEFSVNEKVALEVAFAASITGLRSFVFMKHVGLNVASDPFMSIAYTGVRGGMVIMSADDPSMFSSQNEQDNRNFASFAHIPLIEPSNPQEAKDFLVRAFELSETLSVPVLFRTTTRVSHQRTNVVLSHVRKGEKRGKFEHRSGNYVSLPVNARSLRKKLEEKMLRISMGDYPEDLNRIEKYGREKAKYGIITSGEAYNVITDVVKKNGLSVDLLKLGLTNPLPRDLLNEFLDSEDEIIVVEELDPFLEMHVRSHINATGRIKTVHGKLDGHFPPEYEFNYEVVSSGLNSIMNAGIPIPDEDVSEGDLPPRPPVLCPGCPHRATYYAMRRAVKMMRIEDPIFTSDIGCYSLGFYEPFHEADTMISMGSSEGIANGLSKAVENRIISFIGDSTFFHSGIPPLINAVHNGARYLLVVMDNGTTAMTGQQPNPGVTMQEINGKVSIESIAESVGVRYVRTVDPYDLGSTLRTMTDALKYDGVAVIVTRRECAIIRDSRLRSEGKIRPYRVNTEKCSKCMNCVENFACPAISINQGNITINPTLCDGCGVCAEPYVCPFRAIEAS